MVSVRPNFMWGRTGSQVVVISAIVALFMFTSGVLKSFKFNREHRSLTSITEEQLKVLKALNLSAGEAENLRRKTSEEITYNDARSRSDSLISNVQKICRNFNLTLPISIFMLSHMHFDHKRQAIYCFVPKVACTSWKRIWMKMTNVVKPDKDLSEISRYTIHTSLPTLASSNENISEILSKYKKFMFVRDPFARVLSAYRDKIENVDKASRYDFQKQIGVQIQRKYRPSSQNFTGHGVTFPEFIQFISEPGYGTFEQRNEHWLSTHEICNPCGVKYDFIGKYENLKEDALYVLDWIGAADMVKDFPLPERAWHTKRYDPKYFNQLNHVTKLSFFQKYLLDFIAFNYEFM